MVKQKKAQFKKMVLLPYDDIQRTLSRPFDDGEIDFSKEGDSAYSRHIKLQIKNILRDDHLSAREKSLMIHQLRRKYRISKGNVVSDGLPKHFEMPNPTHFEAPHPHAAVDDEEEEMMWDYDGEIPFVPQASSSPHVYVPREQSYRHPELTDDDDEDVHSNVSMESLAEARGPVRPRPLRELLRPANIKRKLEDHGGDVERVRARRVSNDSSPEHELLRPSRLDVRARPRREESTLKAIQDHIKQRNREMYPEERPDEVEARPRESALNGIQEYLRRRKSKRYLENQPDGDPQPDNKHVRLTRVRKRRDAIDSPPKAMLRLRQKYGQRKRQNAVDSPPKAMLSPRRQVEQDLNKNVRKRSAPRMYAFTKGWLGRRRENDVPPRPKQPKFIGESDETVGDVKWSKLPK